MYQITRTYKLPAALAKRIKQKAVALRLYDSALVVWLLTYALDALDAGRVAIARRPVVWEIGAEAEGETTGDG